MERWGCPAFITQAVRAHHNVAARRAPGGALLRVVALADAMATCFGYEADAFEELPDQVDGEWSQRAFADRDALRTELHATLQEAHGLIMSRTDIPFAFPSPWSGVVEQIVVLGTARRPLEPLQMLVSHAYRSADVVTPANADTKRSDTLVLADLRGLSRSQDAASSLQWLTGVNAPADWPLLVVWPFGRGDVESPPALRQVRQAWLSAPVRAAQVRAAVESMIGGAIAAGALEGNGPPVGEAA
jgi:hypothetical protein